MRLRFSHVISNKYSNGILNLHVHVKKVHVIMSGEISVNVCLFGLSPIGGEFLT